MVKMDSLEKKIKEKSRRPRQEVGIYDPMEQAGHSDMVSVNYVLKELGVVAQKIDREVVVCERMMEDIKKRIADLNIDTKGNAEKVAKLLVDYHTFEVMHAISKQHLGLLVEEEGEK